jgi:hypothetical protein
MMDAIERVAEKLKLAYAASTFMPIPDAETGLWRDMARAAMEAMRPPESHPDDPEWVGENARVINDWIDAALNPRTGS